jgi:hypothetical protein
MDFVEAGETKTVIDACVKRTGQLIIENDFVCRDDTCVLEQRERLANEVTVIQTGGEACVLNQMSGQCKGGLCLPLTCTTTADCTDACREWKCLNGRCIDQGINADLCLDKVEGGAVDWKTELASCNDHVSACGILCTYPNLRGTPCEGGICLASGVCGTPCQSDPGCAKPLDRTTGMIAAPGRCVVPGEVCYQCQEGYESSGNTCIPSPFRIAADVPALIFAQDATVTARVMLPDGSNDKSHLEATLDATRLTGKAQPDASASFSIPTDRAGEHILRIQATTSTGARIAKSLNVTVRCDGSQCCPYDTVMLHGATCEIRAPGASGAAASVSQPAICNAGRCELRCATREVCADRIDNDCNGMTDCDDAACAIACTCKNECTPEKGCGIGERCAYANGCGTCVAGNALMSDSLDITRIVNEIAQAAVRVTTTIDGDTIVLNVRNLAASDLENVTLFVRLNFPDDVLSNVHDVQSASPLRVIDRQVLAVQVGTVRSGTAIRLRLPRAADPDLARAVTVQAEYVMSGEQRLVDEDIAHVVIEAIEQRGERALLVTLRSTHLLDGVRVPIELPKCLRDDVREGDFEGSGDVAIVRSDPLVVWQLANVDGRQTVRIPVNTNDESCLRSVVAFVVADGTRKRSTPWAPLIAVPIIVLAIVAFYRYRRPAQANDRLNRQEFERLALSQGTPPEQLGQAWEDYQKKF